MREKGYNPFFKASPVWKEEFLSQMNVSCGFFCSIKKEKNAVLKIAACNYYKLFINGDFVAYGPARGPHGFFRVDFIDLCKHLKCEDNFVAIEVYGYNVNCFSHADESPFLQVEITSDDKVIAFTGSGGGFSAFHLDQREQIAQRYRFQRTFIEYYYYTPQTDNWRMGKPALQPEIECIELPQKRYIQRGVPYPCYEKRIAMPTGRMGKCNRIDTPLFNWTNRSLYISPKFKGFPEHLLKANIVKELSYIKMQKPCNVKEKALRLKEKLCDNSYEIFDIGINTTGFIEVKISCKEQVELYIVFDEMQTEDDVNFLRNSGVNAIKYNLQAGDYKLLSNEPYVMKYIKVIVLGKGANIKSVAVVQYSSGLKIKKYKFEGMSAVHKIIYDSAVETFMQNSVDLYTDCPGRERAGWLCDSFFTGRAEYYLSGACKVESNFLENYLLPDRYPHIPDKMLPMCYPADQNDGNFIPNWALWFVLELKEYLERSGDMQLVYAFKPKIDKLFEYFRGFENEYGLLEDLDGWVFVDWSDSNKHTNGVNFPSNMIYAVALEAAAQLYGDKSLAQKAAKIREQICALSFDGDFFADNAVRKDGRLVRANVFTEACQSYAFFTKIASPSTHERLWDVFINRLGPLRTEGDLAHIPIQNAFIGMYVRLAALYDFGCMATIEKEVVAAFYHQAKETGTLWEQITPTASLCHGFTGYVAVLLAKIYDVDGAGETKTL